MLSKSQMRQFGELFNNSYGGDRVDITAGAGQDGVENNGDRVAIPDAGGVKRPESLTLILMFKGVLADTVTLSLTAMNYQDADDVAGAGEADFDTHKITATVVLATGKTGGTTALGAFRCPTANLVGASTHVRAQFTIALSSASIDTCEITPIYEWGGYGKEPTTALHEDSNA